MYSIQLNTLFMTLLINRVDSDIVVNDHLLVLVRSKGSNVPVHYQCLTSISQPAQTVQLTPTNGRFGSIAIGKRQSESQLYFVLFGGIETQVPFRTLYMTKVTVSCDNSQFSNQDTVFFDNSNFKDHFYQYLDVSPDGRYALGATPRSLLCFDLDTLQSSTYPISFRTPFWPKSIQITDHYVFIAGDAEVLNEFSVIYLLTINFTHGTDYMATIHDMWVSNRNFLLGPLPIDATNDVNPQILVAFQRPPTVYLFAINESQKLHYISSKQPLDVCSVSWMYNDEKAIVLTRKGDILIYNMGENAKFDDSTNPASEFLFDEQSYDKLTEKSLLIGASNEKSLTYYLENDAGRVFILRPSIPGYYSVPNVYLKNGWVFPYIANTAQCPPYTYKNDSGFWRCTPCQSSEHISDIDSVTPTCPECTKKEYCHGEFIKPLDQFEDIAQNFGYPSSPEVDVFDEIILYSMFRADCGIISPLALTMVALATLGLLSILVLVLKLIKRFVRIRSYLLTSFRHMDLIGQGELWFGGLISIAILILAVFASRFSHLYHRQYPIEKQVEQTPSADSCDFHRLLNSKFDTSLQFLNMPADELEEILGLLNEQHFILNLEIIQTGQNCGRFNLEYVEKNTTLPYSCRQDAGTLYVSATLPVHQMSIRVSLNGKQSTRSVRVGLEAEQKNLAKSSARHLNFSKRFNSSESHRLATNARVHFDLTKIINITEGLRQHDGNTISGIWVPTFTFDIEQMFTNTMIAQASVSTLTITIRETAFFIKNKQKPIARLFEIIFHTFLFIGVCLDVLAMVFLLLKLWIVPLLRFLLKNLLSPTHFLYHIIFEKHPEETPEQIPQNVVCPKTDSFMLNSESQHDENRMEAFIRNTAVEKRSSTMLVLFKAEGKNSDKIEEDLL